MSAENLLTRHPIDLITTPQRLVENTFSPYERHFHFSFMVNRESVYPLVTRRCTKVIRLADSRDTLNARMIAWILVLCKKYLTKRTIRYRLMLHFLIKACRSWCLR